MFSILQFKNINGVAAFISILGIIIIFFCTKRQQKIKWVVAIIIIAILVFLNCRAAIISFLIPTIIIFKPKVKIILLLASFFIISLFILKTSSTKGRVLIISICIQKGNFTFWGNGFNSFERDYPLMQQNYFKTNCNEEVALLADDVRFCFNEPLQLFYEFGVLGVIAVLFSIGVIWLGIFKINSLWGYIALSVLINSIFYYTLHEYLLLCLFNISICLIIYKLIPHNINGKLLKQLPKLVITLISIIPLVFAYNISREYKKNRNFQMLQFESNYSFLKDTTSNALYTNNIEVDLKRVLIFSNSLLLIGDTVNALNTLKMYEKKYKGYNLLIQLGNLNMALQNYSLAKENFINASHAIPNRFLPQYQLMNIYLKENNIIAACYYASKISTKKIKIQNAQIDYYILQAKNVQLQYNCNNH